MSSAKSVRSSAVLIKTESTYNAGASMSLAGVDSVQVNEIVELSEEFAFDGVRGGPPGSLGTQRRTGPSGPTISTTVQVELKGNGSGYATASVDRIPNFHSLLEAAGFSGSLNGLATWSFSPEPEANTPTSIGIELYQRGELHSVSGAYADLTITADDAGPAMMDFAIQGSKVVGIDAVRPATIAYEGTAVVPPKSENLEVTFNFGGAFSSSVVKSVAFALGREITPRLDQNSTVGHAGFNVGRRTPQFTVIFEQEALSAFNPYALLRAGTNGSFNLKWGAGSAANTFEINLPQAQIVDAVGLGDEGGTTATWEVVVQPYVTGGVNDDDITILAY